MWFGCNKRKPGTSNPQKWLVIDEDTINDGNYKVASGTDIYYGEDTSGNPSSIKLGHDDLDVKTYSDAHGGVTDFCVKGTIHFGFMVDPSVDFHLMGANGSEINISTSASQEIACGIIVGQTKQPADNIPYVGNMNIENSADFKIASKVGAYGVYFGGTATGSTQTIDGAFNIHANLHLQDLTASLRSVNGKFANSVRDIHGAACGAYFESRVSGSININGLFTIVGTNTNYGVYFKSRVSGSININGVFAIAGGVGGNYGCCFSSTVIGSINIDGIFTMVGGANDNFYGIYFYSTSADSTQNINGVFTFYVDENAYGVYFYSVASGSLTINGTFTIYSSLPQCNIYSAYFNATASATFSMTTTQFFSNKVDSGNIFTKYQDWGGSYKWNGTTITRDNSTTTSDTSLSLTTIYDTKDDQDYNFFINVIDNAILANKETFNNKLENALDDYIESNDCPIVTEQWLRAIAEQIPLI